MPATSSHVNCPVVVFRLTVKELKGDDLADEIREYFLTLFQQTHATSAVIDFQDVKYLSSAGFRPLLSLQRTVRQHGGRLVLCGLAPLVEEVFSTTRLITSHGPGRSTFEVQPDVPAAVASLCRPVED